MRNGTFKRHGETDTQIDTQNKTDYPTIVYPTFVSESYTKTSTWTRERGDGSGQIGRPGFFCVFCLGGGDSVRI